jgi:hypothetical protein
MDRKSGARGNRCAARSRQSHGAVIGSAAAVGAGREPGCTKPQFHFAAGAEPPRRNARVDHSSPVRRPPSAEHARSVCDGFPGCGYPALHFRHGSRLCLGRSCCLSRRCPDHCRDLCRRRRVGPCPVSKSRGRPSNAQRRGVGGSRRGTAGCRRRGLCRAPARHSRCLPAGSRATAGNGPVCARAGAATGHRAHCRCVLEVAA